MLKKSQVLEEGRNIGLRSALLVLEEVQRQLENGQQLDEGKWIDALKGLLSPSKSGQNAIARNQLRAEEENRHKNAKGEADKLSKEIEELNKLRKLHNDDYSAYLDYLEDHDLTEEDVATLEQKIKDKRAEFKKAKKDADDIKSGIEGKVAELQKTQDEAAKSEKKKNNIKNATKQIKDLVIDMESKYSLTDDDLGIDQKSVFATGNRGQGSNSVRKVKELNPNVKARVNKNEKKQPKKQNDEQKPNTPKASKNGGA